MPASTLSMEMPMGIAVPRGRILCVDDEPGILRALSWLLQNEFEVATAISGREGLDLLHRHDFDVVISDQRMPEMSGVEFLREVRAQAPRAMRILLTGYSDLPAVLRSVNESEIFRYVTKPWNITELPRIVAQAAEIARQEPSGTPPAGRPLAHGPEKARILVLDDRIQVHATVELCAGDLAKVIHATSIIEAMHHLQDGEVDVIVSETRIGAMDLTQLLCLLKHRHPQVVSVVVAEETDIDTVAKLVNHGQIFRLLSSPLKPGLFREALRAALDKSHQMKLRPELLARHTADPLPQAELETLAQEWADSCSPSTAGKADPVSSLAKRMGGYFHRLFVGKDNHA